MTRVLSRLLVGLVVLVAMGASFVACARVMSRGRFALRYSTLGAGPEGTRGAFLLTRSLGASPVRLTEDFGALPEGAMLVALGGCDHTASRELSGLERRELTAWIERGGVLVVAGAGGYLSEDLGVSITPLSPWACDGSAFGRIAGAIDAIEDAPEEPGGVGDDPVSGDPGVWAPDDPLGPDAWDEGLDSGVDSDGLPRLRWAAPIAEPLLGAPLVGLRAQGSLRISDPAATPSAASATTILESEGLPVGVVIERGRGRVIALASATFLTNRDLITSGGAAVFSRLVRAYAPGGVVLFDEYHLGAGERRSFVRYLVQAGFLPVALQGLLVALLLAYRRSARFGAPLLAPPKQPQATASFVMAVGSLFRASRDAQGALGLLVKGAIDRIARHHHELPGEPAAVAARLRARKREAAAALVDEVHALGAPLSHRQELGERARALDAVVARALERE